MPAWRRFWRDVRCLLTHLPAEIVPRFGVFKKCNDCGRFYRVSLC